MGLSKRRTWQDGPEPRQKQKSLAIVEVARLFRMNWCLRRDLSLLSLLIERSKKTPKAYL
jgi:hypothetical protein